MEMDARTWWARLSVRGIAMSPRLGALLVWVCWVVVLALSLVITRVWR